MAEEALKTTDCLTFVEVHGETTCDVNQIKNLIENANLDEKPFVYQFDKHYELKHQASPVRVTLVLYSMIGSAEFLLFHEEILKLASSNLKHSIDYIFRHNYLPVQDNPDELNNKIGLSGYGVELDIKNSEYKAKDDSKINEDVNAQASKKDETKEEDGVQGFVFSRLKQLNPSVAKQLDEYRKHLLESTLELAPLKAWQMQDLSLQAAQQILDAQPGESLDMLEDLSQNFPMRARALSKIQVRSELKKSFKTQRHMLESALNMEPGAGAFYLNGLEVNMDTIDIFSLSALLRKESKLVESLHQIGLNQEQLKGLIYLDTSTKNTAYGIDVRDTAIQWVNNLEKDSKYAHWPRNVQEILRPTYPGMMRSIKKNFFHLVFVLDPAMVDSKVLLKTAESFYVNDIPVRIGSIVYLINKISLIEISSK